MLNLFQHLAGLERLNLANLDDRVKILAQWMFEARYLVVFTGAGISTESGLPDFRGRDGIWTRQRASTILVRACEKGPIEADEAFFKLQKLQSFARYNKTIIETARNQIEGAVKYGKKNDKHTNG